MFSPKNATVASGKTPPEMDDDWGRHWLQAGIMPWDSDFDVKLYTEQDITTEGATARHEVGVGEPG